MEGSRPETWDRIHVAVSIKWDVACLNKERRIDLMGKLFMMG